MIYVFAGHTGQRQSKDYDPGAVANGYTEALLAIELRDLITCELQKYNQPVTNDDDSKSLKDLLASIDPDEKDVILDIHWNAGPASATGTEVFVPERSTEKERMAARMIAGYISRHLGIPNRGVKDETRSARKRLGIMREAGTNLLVEVCFITNIQDMVAYQSMKQYVAEDVAGVLMDAKNNVLAE